MSVPNLKEIEWAIEELEQEESSFRVYSRLADLYTVRNEMMGHSGQSQAMEYSAAPLPAETLELYGDSDFLRAVAGLPAADVWPVMDELMETLHAVNPRVYDSVMRKIDRL